MFESHSYPDKTPAEFRILGAIWRWALPILLLTALTAGAAWVITRSELPLRTVQSELLVRIGYEYTPVPWIASGETQQINFRADEVIGTEIQFLTAERTIQGALAAAPHPEMKPSADGRYDAAEMLRARQKLAVKRLEGSNVILVEVTDRDAAWPIAFSQALLDAYLQDRMQLFSDPAYDNLLKEDEAAAADASLGLDKEALGIGRRIAETIDYLGATAAALAASPAQPELRTALAQDVRALQIFAEGLERMSALQNQLDQLARILAAESGPAATAGTANLVSEELLDAAVEQLASDAARLNAIAAERNMLAKQLDTIRAARLRKSMRDEASHNMTVITPPHILAATNGIDRVQRTILAGLIALILSSLFFVYLDGIRRRKI